MPFHSIVSVELNPELDKARIGGIPDREYLVGYRVDITLEIIIQTDEPIIDFRIPQPTSSAGFAPANGNSWMQLTIGLP